MINREGKGGEKKGVRGADREAKTTKEKKRNRVMERERRQEDRL